MIDRIPMFLPSMIDSDSHESTQAIPRGQATGFLNIFLQTVTSSAMDGVQRATKAEPIASPISMPSFPLLETALDKGSLKNDAIHFVLNQEGSGYVARDGGNESSRYGVLHATARRLGYEGSVKNISRQDAETLYNKIWQESGAESLPRPLAIVHFDTYVNSPAAAKKLLKSSGGDPDAYLDLRSQRYKRLADTKPDRYAKYVKGWKNRIQNLRSLIAENNHSSSAMATT
jgi:lysozyme family protein